MDSKTLRPTIDALNAEIARLTAARDTLQALQGGGGAVTKTPTANRSLAQRKRWAEQKRRQRERAAKTKAGK